MTPRPLPPKGTAIVSRAWGAPEPAPPAPAPGPARERPRAPPHAAADTWSPLQCGARAPEPGREPAGRVAHSRAFGPQRREETRMPARGQPTSGRGPRPARFLESSACRSARPDGRGEGRGGHALGTGSATRKNAQPPSSPHRPAARGEPRGRR